MSHNNYNQYYPSSTYQPLYNYPHEGNGSTHPYGHVHPEPAPYSCSLTQAQPSSSFIQTARAGFQQSLAQPMSSAVSTSCNRQFTVDHPDDFDFHPPELLPIFNHDSPSQKNSNDIRKRRRDPPQNVKEKQTRHIEPAKKCMGFEFLAQPKNSIDFTNYDGQFIDDSNNFSGIEEGATSSKKSKKEIRLENNRKSSQKYRESNYKTLENLKEENKGLWKEKEKSEQRARELEIRLEERGNVSSALDTKFRQYFPQDDFNVIPAASSIPREGGFEPLAQPTSSIDFTNYDGQFIEDSNNFSGIEEGATSSKKSKKEIRLEINNKSNKKCRSEVLKKINNLKEENEWLQKEKEKSEQRARELEIRLEERGNINIILSALDRRFQYYFPQIRPFQQGNFN